MALEANKQEDGDLKSSISQHLAGSSKEDETLQEIRKISLHMFDLLNQGKIQDPSFDALASDYQMTCEKGQGPYTSSVGREAFLQKYLEMLDKNPGYCFNVTDCSVKLSDSNRKASVVLSGDTPVGDKPTNMRMEVVNLLSWEWRRREGWVCVRGKCIRGLAGDSMRD